MVNPEADPVSPRFDPFEGYHQPNLQIEEPLVRLNGDEQALVDLSATFLRDKKEILFNLEGEGAHPISFEVNQAFEFIDHLRPDESRLDEILEHATLCGIEGHQLDMIEKIVLGQTDGSEAVISKEKIKNFLINKKIYDLDIRLFLRENKNQIIQAFGWQDVFHGEVKDDFFVTTGESHNQGRKPAIITFTDGVEKRQFVLKPRDGEIDKRVIGLFERINQERDNQDPPDKGPRLPTYKIVTTKKEEGWVFPGQLHKVSLSQFVGQEEIVEQRKDGEGFDKKAPLGQKIHENDNLESFLKKRLRKLGHPDVAAALASVGFLSSAFAAFGSRDLHNGNFQFDGRPEAPCPIIPVDMEVVEGAGKTDIRTAGIERIPLTDRELEFVKEVRNAVFASDNPVHLRYLPIGTTDLAKYIIFDTPEVMCRRILLRMEQEQGVFLNSDTQKELLQRVRKDCINLDIPIFSKAGDRLFYGEVETGLLLNG